MLWTDELPALAELSAEDAADAINAMTVQTSRYVFGSFRTLAAILTANEYNVLRAAFKAAVATEEAAGGSLYADMQAMLLVPGDEEGHGGGIDLGNPAFAASLAQICEAANIPTAPPKVAAYVASLQPAAVLKYPRVTASEIEVARGVRPVVQQEPSNA